MVQEAFSIGQQRACPTFLFEHQAYHFKEQNYAKSTQKTRLLERRLVNVLEGDAFTTQKVAIILWTQRGKGAKVSFCYSKGQHHLTWVLMCLGTKTISFTPVLQSFLRTNWRTLQSLQISKKLWLLGTGFPITPAKSCKVKMTISHLNDQTTTLHESRAWDAYLIWVILSCEKVWPFRTELPNSEDLPSANLIESLNHLEVLMCNIIDIDTCAYMYIATCINHHIYNIFHLQIFSPPLGLMLIQGTRRKANLSTKGSRVKSHTDPSKGNWSRNISSKQKGNHWMVGFVVHFGCFTITRLHFWVFCVQVSLLDKYLELDIIGVCAGCMWLSH